VPTGAFVARRNGKAFITGNSGFPKSLDVSKAIDKAAGAEREVVGKNPTYRRDQIAPPSFTLQRSPYVTAPATTDARQWQGWGTALKPAYEPIVLARKPLIGTVAANVQQYGTGAINIDGCRVETPNGGQWKGAYANSASAIGTTTLGRWPANLVHDGSEDVLALFPRARSAGIYGNERNVSEGALFGTRTGDSTYDDSGSAARFFYTAKASRRERGEGNNHPTVKPIALMRYLVRLITPPGGLVLDPFAGSGTTGIAAIREGFRFIGIEQSAEYAAMAERRITTATTLPIEASA
jgi:site-specific DNA-methyltransferase (adenine-specific)